MTALAISGQMPSVEIEVIDPDRIPAIGVGESVTGVVQQFVADPVNGLGIPEFFRRTDATLKMGIWYRDWLGKETEYLTPIDAPSQYFSKHYPAELEEFYAMAVADDHNFL